MAAIEGPGDIKKTGVPLPLHVVLTNSGDTALSGSVSLGVIDGWTTAPVDPIPFTVNGGATARLDFTVTPAANTLNAHYPIHAYVDFTEGEQPQRLHPVALVMPKLPMTPAPLSTVEWRPFQVRPATEAPLWRLSAYRVVLAPDAGTGTTMPAGWTGSEPESRGFMAVEGGIDRGGIRECITMHPPWQGDRFRSIVTEFPIQLPETSPLTLRFANAIRDHHPELGEPASDGVTFRVRVVPLDAPEGALGNVVFDVHTDAKTWQAGEADLGAYAGKAVRVQLESHPGPRNNNACDASYWAEPTLAAGTPQPSEPSATPARTLGTIERNGAGYRVEVAQGNRGLLDATVRFTRTGGSGSLSFRGFPLRVLGDDLADARSLTTLTSVREEGDQGPGHFHMRHSFEGPDGPFDAVVELWVGREALQARFRLENVPAPKPWRAVYIEDVAAGPWDAVAKRVYAGHGNVLEEPEAFSLAFDGHRLSTSFVGLEFAGAPAIVQAVDVPPLRFDVDPAAKRYSLHAAHSATLTFIPAQNAWEGASVWHDINGLDIGAGVYKLAGRFVFDLWGGRYADSATALQNSFFYGLVDSAVVWHAWQRYGYDYRLPDIYPPNPHLGSPEELRLLADLCRQFGVYFAPHDNYIDFYPDAEDFSYDKICFSKDGQPVRGWLNESRGAQAYRWRMDQVQPFLQRNLRLIKDNIAPTAYFIDVWSSIIPYDYWTRDGRFFDSLYTRNEIGHQFAWIREHLGDRAPQISESGHDQLIGFLDGAQTNHLRVWRPGEPEADWTVWKIACRDAERVPWLDAAHHDRFVLHGAGYEMRYAGGLDARLHGIYSDDYMCTEVLTGHPPMVSEAFSRDVVRKYWLLHDAMRGLALQRIEAVEFAGNNIHRQHVVWEGGEAWVNRGTDDWSIEGRVLPPFGFYVRGPREHWLFEAAIERRDGVIAEWSKSPAGVYAGARPPVTSATFVSAPDPAVRHLGDGRIELTIHWNVAKPYVRALRAFVHFMDQDKVAFQGDFDPAQPTTEWREPRTDTVAVALPAGARPGQAYEVRVGLYEPGTFRREPLDGLNDGARGIRLGTLHLEGTGSAVTGVSWKPMEAEPRLVRMNLSGKPVNLGIVTTDGACRLARDGEGLRVTPLPDSRPFTVRIRWSDLPWALPAPVRIETLDKSGAVRGVQPVSLRNGVLEMKCAQTDDFAYRLTDAP
jgi:hypothetical protein